MSDPHSARREWEDFKKLAPEADAALSSLSQAAAKQGLDKRLIELVKLRVSQINGCSFCTAWHVNAASRLGLSAEKMHMVAAWHDAPVFDAKERAAFAWAEALTLIANGVPDDAYAHVQSVFSDAELALLTSAILAINAWNRLGVAYRFTPPAIANTAAAA